jgi:hypothetical protein
MTGNELKQVMMQVFKNFTRKRMKTDTNELAQHIGPPRRGVEIND